MLWYYIFKLYRELEGSGIISPSLGGGEVKSHKAHAKNY